MLDLIKVNAAAFLTFWCAMIYAKCCVCLAPCMPYKRLLKMVDDPFTWREGSQAGSLINTTQHYRQYNSTTTYLLLLLLLFQLSTANTPTFFFIIYYYSTIIYDHDATHVRSHLIYIIGVYQFPLFILHLYRSDIYIYMWVSLYLLVI